MPILILRVCVMRIFHTTGGNSPGGTGARRRSFQSRPRARSDTPQGCGGGAPQSSGTVGGAGRLDAFETPILRTDGFPLTRQPGWTCTAPGPVLLMCDCPDYVGSYDILLSPPSGSRLIKMYHTPFQVRRRHLRYIREERAALSCQPSGVADGVRSQPGRGEYPGESHVRCDSHRCEKILAVLPGG